MSSYKGAVACGHPAVAAAAEEILLQGGNAFDAILAAQASAAVAEPVLASLGGGGYLLACPAGQEPVIYDFFAQTPLQKREADVDFYPITADFGNVTQDFHIGLGSCATPGFVKGLCDIHADLASLPLPTLLRSAIKQARDGITVTPMMAYVFDVTSPIYLATADSRQIFCGDQGGLPQQGEVFARPELAGALEALSAEGEELFYQGEMAKQMVSLCREGGHLSQDDFSRYQVIKRKPLQVKYRDATVMMNPPPSSGGVLLAFALALLGESSFSDRGYGSYEHLADLTRVMDLTQKARLDKFHDADVALLDPEYLKTYQQEVRDQSACNRGTTHISVLDAEGNLASMTLSNGEGCGVMVPGSGFMLNNMLGEEDINPHGFGNWRPNERMSSMMTPTILARNEYQYCLGSGGSNRIRSAIMQVIINLVDFHMPMSEAIHASRIHFENGALNLEGGFDPEVVTQLGDMELDLVTWQDINLFFGGVHTVATDGESAIAEGDARRGGLGLVV